MPYEVQLLKWYKIILFYSASFANMLSLGSRFGRIQTESQNLITLMRTYSESKSYELITDHLKKLENYFVKDKNKLKVKDFPTSHKWFTQNSD